MYAASLMALYRAPGSASAADDMTFLMICAMVSMALVGILCCLTIKSFRQPGCVPLVC